MAIRRDLRREINEAVSVLEETDFLCYDPHIFQVKMKQTIALLDSVGISSESEYRKRLKNVLERLNDEEKPIQKQDSLQEYSGLVRKAKIKVCSYNEGYSLRRFPSERTEFSFRWRFNRKGNLEKLDIPNKTGSVKIAAINSIETESGLFEIDYFPIPKKVLPYIHSIQNNPQHIIYGILIRLGYSTLNDLLIDLESKKVKDCYISRNEMNLTEIVRNNEVMRLIRATGNIFPTVEKGENQRYFLRYDRRN